MPKQKLKPKPKLFKLPLDPCAEGHVFTDEPYCDECGLPHRGFWGAIRTAISPKNRRARRK